MRFVYLLMATSLLAACASQPVPLTEDQKAFAATEAAANSGDPAALHRLCYGYIYGKEGFPLDYTQAVYWCKKGAEAGEPNDETLYAELFHLGKGVTQDDVMARWWYKRAAEQGHRHAQRMMARLEYESPNPDIKTFCYWVEKSIAQGYDNAVQLEKDWEQDNPKCTEADADMPEPP
jgi:TPR repeat protein